VIVWVAARRDPDDAHHAGATKASDEIGDESVLVASVTLDDCLASLRVLGVS
jgi:hypothetical protein